MSGWRRKALEMFPEHAVELKESEGIHMAFAALLMHLEHEYRQSAPNRDAIDRTYEFAAWCFGSKQNPMVRNAAAVSFYEHLAEFNPAHADVARVLTPPMWIELRPLLQHVLSAGNYSALEDEIRAATRARSQQGQVTSRRREL
jgi:hypothetical protein